MSVFPNKIYTASDCRSPFGYSYVSGSHGGNRDYWAANYSTGHDSTNIFINNKNYGCNGLDYGCGYGYDYGYHDGWYGGSCSSSSCSCDSGLSDNAVWWIAGGTFAAGLLASPLGGPIIRGIGTGCKYLGKSLWEGGKAIANTLCYAGRGLWNGIRKLFGKEPIENKWETFEMKNPFKSSEKVSQ